MMDRRKGYATVSSWRSRAGSLGAACAVVVGVGVAGVAVAGPAAASDRLGGLTFEPPIGSVLEPLNVVTARGCPAGSNGAQMVMVGPGIADRGQNISGIMVGTLSLTAGFPMSSQYTLADTAGLAYPPVLYEGTYEIRVMCKKKSTSVGYFSSTITFTSPKEWKPAPGGVVSSPSSSPTPSPGASTPAPTSKPSPSDSVAKPTKKPSSGASAGSTDSPSGSAAASESPDAGASGESSEGPSPSNAGESSGEVAAAVTESNGSSGGNSTWPVLILGLLLGAGVMGGATYLSRRSSQSGGKQAL
ncbi:MAG: hypothetical protein F2842_00075 [Actinobacteria bacterium]|uniref:Unannotated protein n=1 Tax=freshwater metagenome TaxID=449393 RepID=A0A6J7Q4E5_9ZZZZ|nr:hypothetical protein [Actinomycetota bacterium]MSW40586.1 hypothetical protein [Actinomycetota bacterium]